MTSVSTIDPPEIELQSVFSCRISSTKSLQYSVSTPAARFSLSVDVPYRHDDREADRLGRIEVQRLLKGL